MERHGNPWDLAPTPRRLGRGAGRPALAEKPDAEYLYWVGCAGSYDERAKKIARAIAQLLEAGRRLDFAILGQEETCTGDPARRAGNELLFQQLARRTSPRCRATACKKIVTPCPHCFNTFDNEYPDFGG